ncbi:MAG TPA: 16S rRNA (uracil(1498)-N(3))-methyltransferase [Gammaproteobacteria bacterium]|nr:16S rRNA (uracil(1498)-N(3))-methyltransferase [Gammaproteobacteria bacterium]
MAATTHRSPRLYVELELDGTSLALDESAAHYLGHVLRLKPGDRLVVFNGRGTERDATVDSLQRRGATLALAADRAPLPESPLDLTLVQALPKSDAMDLIVQKAAELGVRTLVPVYTEFSVVRLDGERSERRVDHWRKIARSACEQCGRHTPPRIEPALDLAAAIEALPATERLALDPSAKILLVDRASPSSGLVVAVGPEGGFGAADWQRLDAAHFTRVALGRRVLRAETAAIAACAIAQSRWGDLGG